MKKVYMLFHQKIDLIIVFLSTNNRKPAKMDPKYLNCRSEFVVGDRVQVSYMSRNESFSGTVSYLEYALMNRGITSGPYTDHIYVSMDDPHVYRNWLSRGSSIISKSSRKKCIIREIYYNDQSQIKQVKIALDDGGYNLYPIESVIGPDEVGSMLIWRAGYNIKGTYGIQRSLRLKIPPSIEIESLPRPPHQLLN